MYAIECLDRFVQLHFRGLVIVSGMLPSSPQSLQEEEKRVNVNVVSLQNTISDASHCCTSHTFVL